MGPFVALRALRKVTNKQCGNSIQPSGNKLPNIISEQGCPNHKEHIFPACHNPYWNRKRI